MSSNEAIVFAGKKRPSIDGDDGYGVMYWAFGGRATPLPLCLDMVNHSPTGFCWGYLGSGPAQLAFAMLYKWLCLRGKIYPEVFARALYQQFKRDVIAILPMDKDFVLRDADIDKWWLASSHLADGYVQQWIRENSQSA